MKRIDVAIAIVVRQERLLICLRKAEGSFGGCWEFPGGKVEPGETIEQSLSRELREELDIEASITAALPVIEHDYPEVHVRLHPFICALTQGEPQPVACDEIKWIEPDALKDYPFPQANAPLIDRLIQHFAEE